MNKQLIIPIIAFVGVLISTLGIFSHTPTSPSTRWIFALASSLMVGTGDLALRAARKRQLATGIIAGIACLLEVIAIVFIFIRNP